MSTLTAERIAEIETRHKARVEFFSENPPRFHTPGYQAHCDRGALLSALASAKAARNSHAALVVAMERLMSLDDRCDFVPIDKPNPEVCPGPETGDPVCHWCEARAALAAAKGEA